MKKPKKEHPPQPQRDQFESEELYWDALKYWMDHHWRPKSTTAFLKERGYTAVKLWKMYEDEVRAHGETARELRTAEREFSDWRKEAAEERLNLMRMVEK